MNRCCFGVAQCHPNTTMVSLLPIVSKLSVVMLVNFRSCDIIMAIAGADRETERAIIVVVVLVVAVVVVVVV